MALKQLTFGANEENKLLRPCWLAGDRKYTTKQFVKLFTRDEINTIDVVASCNTIHDIIDSNQARKKEARNALDTPNCKLVAFKDIARLTLGVSYILRQQVSTLLDETKHLLDQVMGSNAQLGFPATQSSQSQPFGCRKRKQIISKQTTTTTVCVAKRPRIEVPQLLDDQHIDYYRHILSESQLWANECENLRIEEMQTIEVARTCSADHTISVVHELTLTELCEDIIWNDGFGEANQLDVTALEEFLPVRNSLKRKSADSLSTGVLCYKIPRLTENEFTAPITNNAQTDDRCPEIELSSLPPDPPLPVAQTQNFKRKRKSKLKIDKCIKLSRELLLRDRKKFLDILEITKCEKPKIIRNNRSKTLLKSFRQDKLFPGRLSVQSQQTSEQLELDCENTIRAIFGADYTDALASEILSSSQVIPQLTIPSESSEMTAIPTADPIENHSPKISELQQCTYNNNNNEHEHIIKYDDNNFDSLSIMMDLLNIWRNNPDKKSIDANKFIKSFPDRIKAALAFNHLLALSRDGFIVLSTKPASVEIDVITLGVESTRIIEYISNFEQ